MEGWRSDKWWDGYEGCVFVRRLVVIEGREKVLGFLVLMVTRVVFIPLGFSFFATFFHVIFVSKIQIQPACLRCENQVP